MFDSYIDDVFGKRYILKRQSDLTSQKSFKALSFSDENSAYQFLNRVRAPLDYWQKTLSKLGNTSPAKSRSTNLCAQHTVGSLLYRKQLFLFELDGNSQQNTSASKRSLPKSNGDTYVFSHVSSLLVAEPTEVITVHSKADAKKLINELSPSDEDLKQLTSELNISTQESQGGSATKNKLIEALVAGEIIVNVRKPLASPPERETETEVNTADKPAELGPDSGAVTVKQAAANDPMSDINQKSQAETLEKAAEDGKPFCEECEKAKAAKASYRS